MKRFESTQEYYDWVRTIAQRRLERDPSAPGTVAEICIGGVEYTSDGLVLLTTGDPYIDERADPGAVIRRSEAVDYPFPSDWPARWRDVAVNMLQRDLKEETPRVKNNDV